MAAYRRVYDSRHLQADCKEPGSAPEPYARQSSMGYLFTRNFGMPGVLKTRIALASWLTNTRMSHTEQNSVFVLSQNPTFIISMFLIAVRGFGSEPTVINRVLSYLPPVLVSSAPH